MTLAEDLVVEALSLIRDGHDAIPALDTAAAVLRAEAGELDAGAAAAL